MDQISEMNDFFLPNPIEINSLIETEILFLKVAANQGSAC